tara:strand:+ start:2332 stop:3120 length:789 start_codon:yes stop_codon:yes gene_type:complete
MPSLGLGTKTTNSGLITPGIVTDNLVLKHNYNAGSVVPVSNGAAYFDGTTSNNSITTTLAGDTAFKDTDFSMSAWIKRLSNSQYQKVFYATDAGTDRVELYFKNDPAEASLILVIAPKVGTTAAAYCHALTDWNGNYDGIWTHVAATYTAGAAKIYINGVDDTDTTTTNTSTIDIDLSATVSIGERFYGNICNAGLWTRVLTPAEIKSVMWKQYADLTTSEKTSITAWWNLDSEVGSDGNAGSGYVLDENAGAGSTTNLGTL